MTTARQALGAALLAVGIAGSGTPRAAELAAMVTDASGRPLADAVVAVLPKGQRSSAPAGTAGQIAQRGKQFEPGIAIVQTGTAVQFPNFDTVRHHVYSFSPAKRFELKLYAGTPSAPVVFDKPGVAALGCNIHDRMAAWVVVVDTPHFARSDAAGVARLDLPAGEHKLIAWHPRLGEGGDWVEMPLAMGAAARSATVALPLVDAH